MATAADYDWRRAHADPYAGDEPPLDVDRRRIIQSAAFRRLQHKTQVFVAGHGDHYRTRAAHTLEVADLARTLARRTGLNGDLAEIVGLAHDLGHAPFGHAGERALDACLKDAGAGRFEHNAQSLRVVEYLEHPYPEFRGLNLTAAVRACLATHATRFDRADEAVGPAPLESQVAALADELTYLLHDLQDGVYAGLLPPAVLQAWPPAGELGLTGLSAPSELLRGLRPAIDRLRTGVLQDVAAEYGRRRAAGGRADVGESLISPSGVMRASLDALAGMLLREVYGHPTVLRMDAKARRIIRAVFDAYVDNPRLMPRRFAERVAGEGAARVAADYIAGMTDRFCQEEHARLFDARMEA